MPNDEDAIVLEEVPDETWRADPSLDTIQTPTGTVERRLIANLPPRAFREAWRLDGEVMTVDMPAAREVDRNRRRARRQELWQAVDDARNRAVEDGDAAALAAVKIRSQILRNITRDPAIDAAQ